jgi:hypothetical protein
MGGDEAREAGTVTTVPASRGHSVVAGVRPSVWPVVRAIEAIAIKAAAGEMTPSNAKVIVAHPRHVASAKAPEVSCAKASKVSSAKAADVTSAEAADVTSAEAADVTSAKATHVTPAKAAHMASAATTSMSATTASAGLCISGNKAAGKQRACQNHHHSSSHDILRLNGRDCPPQGFCQTLACPRKADANVAMN